MSESKLNKDATYYKNDSRPPCKYGSLCYQKNPQHHAKFKHPGKRTSQSRDEHIAKQPKLFIPEDKTRNSKSPENHPGNSNEHISPNKTNGCRIDKDGMGSLTPCSKTEKVVNKIVLEKDHKKLIKQLFLVNMPEDFYSFWDFCKSLNKEDPIHALKGIKLELVGAFDVLADKITITEADEKQVTSFLRHWRYYYDPPEMQTVLRGEDARQFHLGYFRDDPSEEPVFVASNYLDSKKPERNGIIRPMGANLFAAVNAYLNSLKDGEGDPFMRMKVPKVQKALTDWALDKGYSLSKSSAEMQARDKKVVSKTFHGGGLVVPVNKKMDIGYRELAETDIMIKKILKSIVECTSDEERSTYWAQLQPVITFANIATDECDFGTSLELGLDLFSYGSPILHVSVKQLVVTSYKLLGRPEFSQIIEAHLEDRRSGVNLSVI